MDPKAPFAVVDTLQARQPHQTLDPAVADLRALA
jgi:hypothetical protein